MAVDRRVHGGRAAVHVERDPGDVRGVGAERNKTAPATSAASPTRRMARAAMTLRAPYDPERARVLA
jgi:hypothetical protein